MSLASPGSSHKPLSQRSCTWEQLQPQAIQNHLLHCCLPLRILYPLGAASGIHSKNSAGFHMEHSTYWHALDFSPPRSRRCVGLQLGLRCSKVQTCNWFWVGLVCVSNDSGRSALGSAEQTAATSSSAPLQARTWTVTILKNSVRIQRTTCSCNRLV